MSRKHTLVFILIGLLTSGLVFSQEIDLLAKAEQARWQNGQNKGLPFGRDQAADGTAKYETNAVLEDGKTYAKVLFTHPQWIAQGRILGSFENITIPAKDPRIIIGGGFNNGASGTDGVRFMVNFVMPGTTQAATTRTRVRRDDQPADASVNLCSLDVRYNGKIDRKECDLALHAGKTGTLILLVEAGANADKDWAVWTEAKIFGAAAPQTAAQQKKDEFPKLAKNLKGHGSRIYNINFSPDGKHLVTASGDKTARIWQVPSGRPVSTLRGHSAHVFMADFGPRGGRVVTASGDRTARIWQVNSGAQLQVLSGHAQEVLAADFSPDGVKVATGSDDGTIKIWQAAGGREINSFRVADGGVYALAWHSNGRLLAVGSTTGKVELYNTETGRMTRAFGGHRRAVYTVAFSKDDQRLVSTSVDKTAKIWGTGNGNLVRNFSGQGFYSAVFSPNGGFIMTGNDGRAVIWEVSSGKRMMVLKHTSGMPVRGVCVHPHGKFVAMGGEDNVARIWQVEK